MVIQSKGEGQGVTIGVIQRYANMSKQEVEPCIDALKQISAIIVNDEGRTKRYVAAISELPARKWT